jgi:hypothetical protein
MSRLEPLEMQGRHWGVTEDREREILVWIHEHAPERTPIARQDLREHVTTHYDFPITRGWVRSFMGRDIDELCKVKSSPQEAEPLEIPRCFLDQTLICITQFVRGRPTELVFNLDEVGISEWEDRKTKTVLVPKSMSEQMMHHKVNRNLKHVSVIEYVSVAGESLIPDIVPSQDSAHVR